jgi:hypothetical protein
MERADGVSSWSVDGVEVNAEDSLAVDDAGVVSWAVAGLETGRIGKVEMADPGAARLVRAMLAEKRRVAERERRRREVHPAPKPSSPRRGRKVPQVVPVECPGCDGRGDEGCETCRGDGWVRIHG